MNLKEKKNNLTTSPGVYLMKDSLGNIIYVGKAKNLKNRVLSYFRNSKSHSPKVEKLIRNLKDFDYIITDTEFEAFMLECKLIRELKPAYNKIMKNPLSYTYIAIRREAEHPEIDITFAPVESGSYIYFGPYANKNTVERALQGVKECYKMPCSNPFKKNSTCLKHALGLCIGMCIEDSAAEYCNNVIDKLIALLNGTDTSILKAMEEKMIHASEKMDFETAVRYRDYIASINSLVNREKVIKFTNSSNNILIIEHLSERMMKLFLVRGSKILFSEKYITQETDKKFLCEVVKRHVLVHFSNKLPAPLAQITKDEIDDANIIYNYLKSHSDNYSIIPQQWLDYKSSENLEDVISILIKGRQTA